MKRIVKGAEPSEIAVWRRSHAHDLTYQNMPKDALRRSLVAEQGNLCAYTMLRIETTGDGHIEHIVPREQSPALETAYENLVYCFPGKDPSSCPFGAGRKDNARVTPDAFVSPLDSDCEERFVYGRSGAVGGADSAAQGTIAVLDLNHNVLVRARKAAIAKLPVNKTKRPLSQPEALQRAQELLNRDAKGRFIEFAVALSQTMKRYASQKSPR